MGKPQTITTETGEELVVLSRRDYDALLARLGDTEAEDAMTARILAETAGDTALPDALWDDIEAAPSPIGPLRRFHGLTQAELSAATDISQGYLSALESGKKTGDVETLRKLSRALKVGLDVLAPD